MATNFGFGSLTGANGQKIDWETLKKYDANQDGSIDAVEYHAMLNEMDPDGFNGISAFGTMNANGDKLITEEEFKLMEQKVAMGEHVDSVLEDMATAGELTSGYKNAITSYLKNYATTYMTAHPDAVDGMLEQFKIDVETFCSNYEAGLGEIEDIKKNSDYAKTFTDSVTDGNKNGYITGAERAAINDSATDYSLQQALKGDYSFLIGIGVSSKDISNIKVIIAKLNKTVNIQATLDEIRVQIKTSIVKCNESKLIDSANKLAEKTAAEKAAEEAAKKAAEEAKNAKPAGVYTVNSPDLDYSRIDGYEKGSTVTSGKNDHNGIKNKAGDAIEKLHQQIRDKVKANCAANGLNYDEALVDSIFDSAKTATIGSCIHGKDGVASRFLGFLWPTSHYTVYSYNTETLINTFVNNFNKLMKTEIDKLNAVQVDANHVPTFDNITSSYLDKPDTDDKGNKLSADQLAMKNLQKDFVTDPDAKIGTKTVTTTTKDSNGNNKTTTTTVPDYDKAAAILDIVGVEVKSQMIKAGVNEAVITRLIGEAKTETKGKIAVDTKKPDMVKSFIELIQKKCADYKTTNAPLF